MLVSQRLLTEVPAGEQVDQRRLDDPVDVRRLDRVQVPAADLAAAVLPHPRRRGPGLGITRQASVLVFAGVLLTTFPSLGGWDQGGVLIASIRLLSRGITVATFGAIWWTPFLVQEGC
jgi:hypothetical protein